MNAQDSLVKGRVEFPQLIEKVYGEIWFTGVTERPLAGDDAFIAHLLGFFAGCSVPERTVLTVHLSSLCAIFAAFCVQMAQNNMLVIHLSTKKCNVLQASFP